ncbi:hypothetical protein [Hydrogenophaga sp.]|uniref:hypothetical protein n=1 Tax=Hydrogenophaga sp. TaxID=1904254 RepID=UPI003AF5E55E
MLLLFFEKLTDLISGGETGSDFSRDESVAMAGIERARGHFDEPESKIIRKPFRFKSSEALGGWIRCVRRSKPEPAPYNCSKGRAHLCRACLFIFISTVLCC